MNIPGKVLQVAFNTYAAGFVYCLLYAYYVFSLFAGTRLPVSRLYVIDACWWKRSHLSRNI